MLDGPQEAELEMHTTGGHLADDFDLGGPNYSCQTACAASSQAIGEAVEMIRFGDADVMLRRRVAQHDPPARRHRVQPAHRPVHPQRQPRTGRAGRST